MGEGMGQATRLWLDVEDLFEYAQLHPRPSGAQRIAFEIYRTLHNQYGSTNLIRFVRHDAARNTFRTVSWSEIAALFEHLTEGERSWLVLAPHQALPFGLIRRLEKRFPLSLQNQAGAAMRAQAAAFRTWAGLLALLGQGMRWRVARLRDRLAPARATGNDFAEDMAPGDLLVVLGSPLLRSNYAGLIQAHRARGLRFALLVYDLIPLRHPEWYSPRISSAFRAWHESILRLCDFIFAISRATAVDVLAYARDRGQTLPPVIPLPMGTSFGAEHVIARRTERLPVPGTYALFVSTIDVRKNHLLLFRVWQRLLCELPEANVPTLVFAGKVGLFVDDLLWQIADTDNLQRHLVIIENPTDAELVTLYQGCLFTLYPSFAEGWGLPVRESLSFGKACLIADRASLLEASDGLARCFDPDNLNEAYATVREVIEDREGLAHWEAWARQEFRPVPWSATVEALLKGLEHPLATRSVNDDSTAFLAS
jgi:glycosyltransferase involved in cell wall biosynthesis